MDVLVDFLLNFQGPMPYVGIFSILLACGFGLPVPEDITLFAAGLLAYYGLTGFGLTILISLLGVLIGDSTIFFLGARYGRKLTKKWFFHRLLPDERLDAVREKFHQRGLKLLFAARFMPGLRAPIYFSAGTLHVPFRKFILLDGAAALISVPLIVGSVYFFGDQLDQVIRIIKSVEHGIFMAIAAAILMILGKWYITHRKLRQTS